MTVLLERFFFAFMSYFSMFSLHVLFTNTHNYGLQITLIDGITLILHRGIHLQLNLTVTVTSPLRTSDCLFILFLFSPGSVFYYSFAFLPWNCLFILFLLFSFFSFLTMVLSFCRFLFKPWYTIFIIFLFGHDTVILYIFF